MREAFYLLVSGDPETWGIVLRSLRFAVLSTFFSVTLGIPVGMVLSAARFPGRRALIALVNALMAVPTVVIGLVIYSLISRSGPLGPLNFLYAPPGIILGQSFLAFPVVASLTYAGLSKLDSRFRETLTTLGAGPMRRLVSTIAEARVVLIAAVVSAFGRVVGEVGVSMMLGGNIRNFTRTMTTAIALDASKGEFERAVSLGLVLFSVAMAVNLVLHLLPHNER